MNSAHRVAAIGLIVAAAGCGSTQPPTAPTPPPATGTVSFLPGDIVYHRPSNGATEVSIYIGTGSGPVAAGPSLECLVAKNANDDWPCGLPARLQVNQDYWVYVNDNGSASVPLGLKGSSVFVRGKEVTRTTAIFSLREQWTGGLFTIVDATGLIR